MNPLTEISSGPANAHELMQTQANNGVERKLSTSHGYIGRFQRHEREARVGNIEQSIESTYVRVG